MQKIFSSSKIVNNFFCYSLSTKNNSQPKTHPLQSEQKTNLIFQYPLNSSNDKSDSHRGTIPLPQHLELFCFPHQNCHLSYPLAEKTLNFPVSSAAISVPKLHTFVTTDECGLKQYAVCLTFYRSLSESQRRFFQDAATEFRKSTLNQAEFEYVQSTIEKYHLATIQLSEAKNNPYL